MVNYSAMLNLAFIQLLNTWSRTLIFATLLVYDVLLFSWWRLHYVAFTINIRIPHCSCFLIFWSYCTMNNLATLLCLLNNLIALWNIIMIFHRYAEQVMRLFHVYKGWLLLLYKFLVKVWAWVSCLLHAFIILFSSAILTPFRIFLIILW